MNILLVIDFNSDWVMPVVVLVEEILSLVMVVVTEKCCSDIWLLHSFRIPPCRTPPSDIPHFILDRFLFRPVSFYSHFLQERFFLVFQNYLPCCITSLGDMKEKHFVLYYISRLQNFATYFW